MREAERCSLQSKAFLLLAPTHVHKSKLLCFYRPDDAGLVRGALCRSPTQFLNSFLGVCRTVQLAARREECADKVGAPCIRASPVMESGASEDANTDT